MIAAIVRFSIRNPGAIVVFALAVLAYGLYTLTRANYDVFPEFSPTQVVIQTEAPGLPAELVEALVSQPIESALAGVAGVEFFRSQSIPGLSVVTVLFKDGSDLYRNRQLVSERLSAIAARMPAGVSPKVTPLTSSASTLLGVGLTSTSRSLMELRTLTESLLRPHLLAVSGVADVNVFGGQVRQWQIQVDPQLMIAHGLALEDILRAARAASGVVGAGYLENQNQRIIVSVEGQSHNARQLGQTVVAQRGGRGITLGDIADVAETAAASISAAAINGQPGVFLMVQGQLGANTLAVTAGLERALDEVEPVLRAERVQLHRELFRPANFIETALSNVQRDLWIGSVLVMVVLFAFLFNVRTAVISATAIPLSLIAAVIVLNYLGLSMNIMVIGGLAIALGEVVDDAIIDSENIFRRLRENRARSDPRPAWQVVYDASMEVRASVVYATFIVALVFVPLLTLSGIAGKLFAPLGLAYILAILASLAVALTLTPALAYLLLARAPLKETDPPLIGWLKPKYRNALSWIERHPMGVIASVGFLLAGGVAMLPLFGGEFIPPLKEGHYIIHMSAIPGTSERESLRIGQRVSAAIGRIAGVKSVAQWVGRAEAGADTFGTHYSEFEVEIGPLPGREQRRILAEIRAVLGADRNEDEDAGRAGAQGGAKTIAGADGFVGVNFSVNTFLTERIGETIAGYAAPVVVNIFGAELDTLDRDAQLVAQQLSSVRGAREIQVLAPPGTPQLSMRLRHEQMRLWNVTPVEIMEVIRAIYHGVPVGQVYQGNLVTEVVVTMTPHARAALSEAGAITLRTASGKLLKLAEVVHIQQVNGRYKILRENGKRMQSVTANVYGRDVEDVVGEFKQRMAQGARGGVALSAGNYFVLTGAAQAQRQAREDLIVYALLAGVGIFLLLYVAFNNLRNLAVTFVNLPFALLGGVVAVLVSGGWLSLGSLVGFVTLFGITLRNSIMLVSHYQHLVDNEAAAWNAVTAQRGAAERLPSILMTALVTALGLLPLALGSGEPGREIEGPMASIIVGGLVTSTLLNLLVLPTLLLHFGRFTPRQRE